METLHLTHFTFSQLFRYVHKTLPSVRVIRGLRVSKDTCPWLRWCEPRPALQSHGSQSPAETTLRCRAHMAERVSIAQWAQPAVGSPGPSRATTLSKEFKLCMTKVTPIYKRGAVTTTLPVSPRRCGKMS